MKFTLLARFYDVSGEVSADEPRAGRDLRSTGGWLRSWFCVLFVFAFVSLAGAQTNPPNTYYDNAIGKTGAQLKTALHDIIKNHTQLPYTAGSTDTWDALKDMDQDPGNANNVLLVYSGLSDPKSQQDTGSSGTWNREHLWPQSYGLERLMANSRAKTDVFNLRPCDIGANSSRGNKYYDTSTGSISHYSAAPQSSYDSDSWEPRTEDKGDICRSLFYMDVRYDGTDADVPDLDLSDVAPVTSANRMGKLTTLLAWNRLYAVTTKERVRNHRIYTTYQFNRNPFVDHPEFADMVFTSAKHVQAWKNIRFTTAELANQSVSGDLADADGDRLPNLVEYKFNRNPRAHDTAPLFAVTRNPDATLQIVYVRNRFAADVTLSYEISGDLKTWTAATPSSTTTSVQSYEAEQVTAKFTGTGPGRFVRIKLVDP